MQEAFLRHQLSLLFVAVFQSLHVNSHLESLDHLWRTAFVDLIHHAQLLGQNNSPDAPLFLQFALTTIIDCLKISLRLDSEKKSESDSDEKTEPQAPGEKPERVQERDPLTVYELQKIFQKGNVSEITWFIYGCLQDQSIQPMFKVKMWKILTQFLTLRFTYIKARN